MHNVIKQRMTIMKKAVQMHEAEGYEKVLEAYDAMWGRIVGAENSTPTSLTYVGELVEQFVAECLTLTSDDQKLQAKDLYAAFHDWCKSKEIESIPSGRKFGEEMALRFARFKNNKVWYVGVALQQEEK